MPLIAQPFGDYRFLPGIAPYSCGAVAAPGFEIVHAVLQRPLPWRIGFDRLAQHLESVNRPRAALCGVELRSPKPFTFAGFAEFNHGYTAVLESWGLFVNGINPIPRTNVAPAVAPPSEPVLYGFSYTIPTTDDFPPTFVVAGGGELPEGILEHESIIALGDISPTGIEQKAAFVMDRMEDRLRGLGVDWPLVTAIDVYTVRAIEALVPRVILGRTGSTAIHGVHWHYSRPPIEAVEFEMDLRGVRVERRLAP